jgi:L-threonylcarbamoyladenylate synthase
MVAGFSRDISNCMETLKKGGVIVYPTDTVWGIGCDATNAAAIENVFALKNRPAHKSMIVLLADAADLAHYVALPDPEILKTIAGFDRPTTVVYPQAHGLAANALAADGSIGIRIVNDPFCKELIRAWGKPLISTSANISGQPTASLFREIDPMVLAGADYVVQYRRDDNTVHLPSRIVKISERGALEIIRP